MLFAFKEISEADVQAEEADLESNLQLLGASGLEDLLQDDVAECIQDFKLARCKVWMLTGDKGETAKNIGISCGIIDLDKQELFKVNDVPSKTLASHFIELKEAMGE